MSLTFAKKALLAKAEVTYGTDPTPTGAANAVVAKNLTITPLEATMAERALALPYFGSMGVVPGSAFVKLDFEVELGGSGTAGTAPAYDPLLQACAALSTNNVGVSQAYTPESANIGSVTLYYNLDGVQHKVTGARGNVALDFNNDGIPVFKFSLTGIYNAPTDTALPSLTITAWKTPIAFNKVNSLFTLGGITVVVDKFSLDFGNSVVAKSYVNTSQDVKITDRKTKAKITMEAGTIAAHDWFTDARNAASKALLLTHGTVAGNKVLVSLPQVQLGNPKYTDVGGVAMLDIDLYPLVAAGNDEFTITVE